MTRSKFATRMTERRCMGSTRCPYFQSSGDKCSGCAQTAGSDPEFQLKATRDRIKVIRATLGMREMAPLRFEQILSRIPPANEIVAVSVLIDEMRHDLEFFSKTQATRMCQVLKGDTFHGVVASFSMEPWALGHVCSPMVMCYWGNYGAVPTSIQEIERCLTLSRHTLRGNSSTGHRLFE